MKVKHNRDINILFLILSIIILLLCAIWDLWDT